MSTFKEAGYFIIRLNELINNEEKIKEIKIIKI